MKLLVDMNLSPSWVDRLARHGFQAVHWSTIGAATAPDSEILTWATEQRLRPYHERSLDFSSILAASAEAMPSVVQIRTQDLLAEYKDRIVRVRNHGRSIFLPICSFPSAAGGARCRRPTLGAAVAAEQSGQWGVSDPHLAAPFFAPRLARRGSLTPHMHVTFVRRNRAPPSRRRRVRRL